MARAQILLFFTNCKHLGTFSQPPTHRPPRLTVVDANRSTQTFRPPFCNHLVPHTEYSLIDYKMAANSAVSVPHEAAPPVRNESKRERKRQLLQDRLQQMSENFTRGRDNAYREQLQKIQLDTTLIMRVDPYSDRPLEALEDQDIPPLQNTDPTTARTLLDMAGPRFKEWIQDVEDLLEERDYEITKHQVSISQLHVPRA